MISAAFETLELSDEEELTQVDLPAGATPQVAVNDRTTAQVCLLCGHQGHQLGSAAVPGVDRFDLGLAHAYNHMYGLMIEVGISAADAEMIVLKLRQRDSGV